MKIIIYSITDEGKEAIKSEFVDFSRMSSTDRKQFLALFKITKDLDKGMLCLQGSSVTDYVQPWALKAKINECLEKSNCKENLDYRVVLE